MRKLLFTITVLTGLSFITACEMSDELLRKNLGTFDGKTSDGRKCEVKFSKLAIPAILGNSAIYLAIKIWPTSADGIVSTKAIEYNFVQPSDGTLNPVNRFKIVDGDVNNPKVILFQNTVQVVLSDKFATSVQFNSGEDCLNLIKRK